MLRLADSKIQYYRIGRNPCVYILAVADYYVSREVSRFRSAQADSALAAEPDTDRAAQRFTYAPPFPFIHKEIE